MENNRNNDDVFGLAISPLLNSALLFRLSAFWLRVYLKVLNVGRMN